MSSGEVVSKRLGWFESACKALIALCIVTSFFVMASGASAAPRKGYEALQTTMSGSGVTLAPGEQRRVMVGFLNKGTTTWTQDGDAFVSIYTYGPKYRDSVFESTNWFQDIQPAKLQESRVAPGEVGHIMFTVTAPQAPGTYRETFKLAAEETTWIPGGEFTFVFTVSSSTAAGSQPSSEASAKTQAPADTTTPSSKVSSALPDGTASPLSEDGLSAMVLLRGAKNLRAEAGEVIEYKIGIKNTGTKSWNARELRTSDLALASVSDTQHSTWVSSSVIAQNSGPIVKPGALEFFSFTFVAPKTKGSHIVSYRLAVDGEVIPDFQIDIPIEVTSGAAEAIDAPVVVEETQLINKIDEPIMRVGVLIVDEETDWQVEISCQSSWRLEDGNGGLLGVMQPSESVRAFYKNQRYYFNRGKGVEQSVSHLRFIPDEVNTPCAVDNFDRRVTRRAGYADNTFRNILELRYNSAKDRTWVINELPMEMYLRGLAETSNVSHHEFKKTLMVIARTYALYHWERGTKRGPEHFTVTAYSDDQVYKGYEYEMRHPRIGKAAEDTRGQTVTYEGRTAITPYFSRSDGRTRDWSEVWYGEVAWAKSVPTPCDAGKTLWGHGVGLSASAALCQANQGKKYDDILKYFYQGIELSRRWE